MSLPTTCYHLHHLSLSSRIDYFYPHSHFFIIFPTLFIRKSLSVSVQPTCWLVNYTTCKRLSVPTTYYHLHQLSLPSQINFFLLSLFSLLYFICPNHFLVSKLHHIQPLSVPSNYYHFLYLGMNEFFLFVFILSIQYFLSYTQ